MPENLVIVESPAKARTIEKFLGKNYSVASSFGHVADLPSKKLGVDVQGDFSPDYQVLEDKKKIIKDLKYKIKQSKMVWLASDEDREGEAIAWHLKQQLELQEEQTKRIVFHEITKKAIQKAIANPRKINADMVDAQQARRVLDRLVGYELSPVLWKKVKMGLSAGRVQSVAVRLIVEKEVSIVNFNIQEFYKIAAHFLNKEHKLFKAQVSEKIQTQKEALDLLEKIKTGSFKVLDLQKKPAKKSPAPPFTTSTLQQEASRKLHFSVSRTMQVAQRLYESGFITYMRTDSFNLSSEAKQSAATQIHQIYGENYVHVRNFKTKSKSAQEAHEAIRPTDMAKQSITVDNDQNRLYNLIWKRTIASQMANAQLEKTHVKISHSNMDRLFTAHGEMIKFDGFLKVYLEGRDDEEPEQAGMLPKLAIGDSLVYKEITATQSFTKPPYRFTEASLVKKLEELGIGRPSTYAPTISTIQKRGYVEKGQIEGYERKYTQFTLQNAEIQKQILKEKTGSDKGKLVPTDMGNIVNDFLVDHFKDILDFGFTANLEMDFDKIAQGKVQWKKMVKRFYQDFHPVVNKVSENAQRQSGERILGKHPDSGKTVLVRLGRFGPIAQIGTQEDPQKQFASLDKNQNLSTITLQEALDLFLLPKDLGTFENKTIIVANGRYGPYIKFNQKYISIPKDENPLQLDYQKAVELIKEKQKADQPIAHYEGLPVQKAVGRFGPYIKWNNLFINVSKKYDFDNLSQEDITELIEDKKQKEKDKLIHYWEAENIRVEKDRWGRFHIIKGKSKIELPKTFNVSELTLEKTKELIEKRTNVVKKGVKRKR